MTPQTLGAAIDRITGDLCDAVLIFIAGVTLLALYLNAPGVIYGWP